MGVLWVLLYHKLKVLHSLLVLLDHLVGFGTLVDVAEVGGDHRDAVRVGEDGLFKLLQTAVREPQMIVDVGPVAHVRPVQQRSLQRVDTLLVLFGGKLGHSQLVMDLWVSVLD